MAVQLRIQNLIDGAKSAAKSGQSFDQYCEIISIVVISGQTKDEVKAFLTSHQIDKLFDE
jgi:phosphoglycolate phosphatase-like HAD superfamily hydrolase